MADIEIIYFKGGVALYYIENAASMATSVTTTTSVTSTGSPSYSARMYEFTGVGTTSALEGDDADNNESGSDTVVQGGNVTSTDNNLVFVASIGGSTAGSGYTSGVVNADQYIANATANTVYGTSYGNSADYWACVACSFYPLLNVEVTPGQVGATFGVEPYPLVKAEAGATVFPAAVTSTFGMGLWFIPMPGTGYPFQVGATFGFATDIATGNPIDYGNVVSGSAQLPSGVNSTYFYARFTGWLQVPASGLYTIGVNCQDGCDLYIGTQPIVRALSASQTAYSTPAYTNYGQIELAKNVAYPLVLEWQHGSGASYECQLLWTPPANSLGATVIPVSQLELSGYWWNGTSSSWYPNTWY